MSARMATFSILVFALAASAFAQPHPNKTREIAPGVFMPSINLGTCCGSSPKVGLKPWLDAGGTGIDTAFDYHDQTDIATVLANYPTLSRKDLFILTKVPAGFGNEKDCSGGSSVSYNYVKENLRELNTSYADIVLLHHPCPTPEDDLELWKGLQQAQKEGLTRAIGVSNYKTSNLEALIKSSGTKPSVNQCSMSLFHHDDDTIEYCLSNNITYEAFDAMKGCPFSNKKVQGIASKYSVEVSQVCLRWVLQRGCIMAVGTGTDPAKAAEYAKEDLDLYGFNLSPDDMKYLNSLM